MELEGVETGPRFFLLFIFALWDVELGERWALVVTSVDSLPNSRESCRLDVVSSNR